MVQVDILIEMAMFLLVNLKGVKKMDLANFLEKTEFKWLAGGKTVSMLIWTRPFKMKRLMIRKIKFWP